MSGTPEHTPTTADALIGAAWAAMARPDPEEALRLWRAVRDEAPDRPEGYIWPLSVLWQAGRFDEAEAMATAANARFPDDEELLVQQAWLATSQQQWPAAAERWAAVRARAPERREAHVQGIHALWLIGRLDQAEAMAAVAAARFPGSEELLVQRAWLATSQQRWPAAAERWAAVRVLAPERVEAYVQGVHALWLMGRPDDAEAVAREGAERFAGDPALLAESAWIATARRDWAEALRRWTRVAEARPEGADAPARIAQALRFLGRIDEGETMAGAALADHPDDTELLIEYAWFALARGEWGQAADRLDAAYRLAKHPQRVGESFAAMERQIRLNAALGAGTSPARTLAPPGPAVLDEPERASDELMLRFESIGERCDFGAVQRHFGVDPLGLLRFAWSRLDPLVAALDDRFEAVGTVEDTGFDRYGDETIVLMRKYGLIFHTFVEGVHERPAEQREAFYERQRRRLLFLKDKLIRDLAEPQKILVYATDDYAADEDAARLFAALRAYGPNTLLYVRRERSDRPAGTVERLDDRLFAGYFPGLADFVSGDQPPFDLWQRLCLRTLEAAAG